VSIRTLAAAWNRFFFTPQSPLPIAWFRILYGCLIIANLILLYPDWLTWFGTRAWVSSQSMAKLEPGVRLNLFTVLPPEDRWVLGLFWVFLVWALLLTVGFLTRISSVAVFLCLVSIHQRNLYILHGGDAFLRVAGFFLMFSPAGAALSVDRLIRIRKRKESPALQPKPPWAQRMIQFELALLYFVTFCWKASGTPWVNGTALFYVAHLDELRHFPVPAFLQNGILLKLGSWLTLAAEFALAVLIWFRELRYPVLAMGVVFHLCLEYCLNIPLFQWEILSAYVLFIDPEDLERIRMRFVKHRPNGVHSSELSGSTVALDRSNKSASEATSSVLQNSEDGSRVYESRSPRCATPVTTGGRPPELSERHGPGFRFLKEPGDDLQGPIWGPAHCRGDRGSGLFRLWLRAGAGSSQADDAAVS
jgi:hypothetical protein